MKILYSIAGTYNSGGMERVLANKANWLVAHGHEVIIVTTDQRGESPYFPLDARIKCYDLAINYEENNGKSFLNKLIHYPFKQWKHKVRLTALLKELRPDIVISMFCNDDSFIPSIKDGSKRYWKYISLVSNVCSMGEKGCGVWQTGGDTRQMQEWCPDSISLWC